MKESSDLTWTDGGLWTLNDAGNPAEFYRIDTSNGNVAQTISISNFSNIDWEELAADSNYFYIGDFGNNDGNRKNLRVLKVDKKNIGSAANVSVQAEAIYFSYPDQTDFNAGSKNNFDCESMLVMGDSLYLFSKDRGDSKTRLYSLPKKPGTYSAILKQTFDAGGLITGADINPNLKEIMLIGYLSPNHSKSFIWVLQDFVGTNFFSGNQKRIEIGMNNDWQTEGIAYRDSTDIWISNEACDILPSIFRLSKNALIGGNYNSTSPYHLPNSNPFPNPVSQNEIYIAVQTMPTSVMLYNACLFETPIPFQTRQGFLVMDIPQLSSGAYYLKLQYPNGLVQLYPIQISN